ncbi:MAG TPA: carbamoyltransferase HypF [Dehalococcoidia bacterium]|nr:carbamoyltransferase HypF [Dehalococcoidia bacterium]
MAKTKTVELLGISVRGVVQGVGFRPFVYQLAAKHGLKGWVCNTSGDVKIEVEGEGQALERFLAELESQAPPLARIESIATTRLPPVGYADFHIRESIAEADKYQLVSPDIATCQPCQKEVFDPQNRRYRYPFTNCTNCGPRFTIIEDIPYDRPLTTMRRFRMCPHCQREYDDPLDRRFHAQPNACPRCGPRLELTDNRGNPIPAEDVLTTASQLLQGGKIVAVKGLGGFLLACDATSQEAVRLLRQRKRRPFKPLAIMVASLEEARKHCQVSAEEERLLLSPESPIVLLPWKAGSPVTPEVAPNLRYLGVMLPYTPLHHLLLRETGLPLVMTSGNLSEEPIAKDNDEALRRLGNLADYFLMHDRDIYARYDDSVTMVELGRTRVLRRARGYAPYPIHLPFPVRQILACGAELKNTFCLTREGHAFLSQHIGDLENLETLEHFETTIELYKKLFRIQPEAVAYDMHPEYLSTKYTKELQAQPNNLAFVPVQHHHAHIVSCMVENGVSEPVIGVSLDGVGYGTDGLIWGGEFLVADYGRFQRWGHLENMPLPGGAAAIKRPYRMALSYLLELGLFDPGLAFLKEISAEEIRIVRGQVEKKFNSPLTSSLGRLFDGVSALIGLRGEIDYEAQAAIELEMLSAPGVAEEYPFSIAEEEGKYVIKLGELFVAIISDMKRGTPNPIIAARFHNTVTRMVLRMCQLISEKTGLKVVALSGGVFQNRLLFRLTHVALEGAGFQVLSHNLVPTNDGGISLGQAVIANAILDNKKRN